jgi:Holliday junction resolvase - archaeal type
MAKRSVAKGKRREREVARLLGGRRVPLSGAAEGFPGDVVLPCGWRVEVKARRDGFKQLYRWLEKADALAIRADRRPWLLVLPLERAAALLRGENNPMEAEIDKLLKSMEVDPDELFKGLDDIDGDSLFKSLDVDGDSLLKAINDHLKEARDGE